MQLENLRQGGQVYAFEWIRKKEEIVEFFEKVNRACSTYGGGERSVHCFGGDT
jgi:hypothetical protein